MANLKFTEFGGILPSVDARKLPPTSAQSAVNLDLRFGDFRPLKGLGSSVASVPVGTRSIFRTPSGVWLSSTTDANYVNGQIPDAASERVYLTGRSAYPEAWQGGSYRRLGVPAPSLKPDVAARLSDQFTEEDRAALLDAAKTSITAALLASSSSTTLGTPPQPTTPVSDITVNDAGDQLGVWVRSANVTETFNTSVIRQVTFGGSSRYATVRDEGNDKRAYAHRDFGIATADETNFSCNVQFHHGGVNHSWYSRREAQVTVQGDATGSGVRVALVDYDGMRGNPNGAFLCIDAATGWDTGDNDPHTTALAYVALPGHLAQLTDYTITVKVTWTGATTATVLAKVFQGATELASVTTSGTFGRGGHCGFHHYFGPDANSALDGLPSGFITYWDDFAVTATTAQGFWRPHGDDLGTPPLPTLVQGDFGHLAAMSADLMTTDLLNPNQAYLKDASLNGVQVTYSGVRYWAVPALKYMAQGRALNEASLRTALAAIMDPRDATRQLLSAAQIDQIVADSLALFAGTSGPTAALMSALKAAESEVLATLATGAQTTGSTGKVLALTTALTNVAAAADALSAWWNSTTLLPAWVGTSFSSSISAGLPNTVVRTVQTRTYIVTYVTDWGEESAPSAASALLDVDQNDAVKVTATAPPPGRFIVGWRLYRSASSNTQASWALVEDLAATNAVLVDGVFDYFNIADLTYTDSKADEELQEPCPSLTWAEPPADLKGLVGLPNGIMAGFVGRTLCFSVPSQPHAWPIDYQLSLEYDIVGIGVFGQTAVVLTQGFPYYASGADSASMSAQKVEVPQACLAPRSIATVDGGVMYASPDGLCLASASGISLLTQGAFTKDDWLAAVTSGAVGAYHDGAYYLYTG